MVYRSATGSISTAVCQQDRVQVSVGFQSRPLARKYLKQFEHQNNFFFFCWRTRGFFFYFPQSVNISETCNSSTAFNHTNSSSSKLNCPERNSIYFYFNVTNLKYPFTHYDFRIYVRSSIARGEDKWSAPGCITLTTKSTSKFQYS